MSGHTRRWIAVLAVLATLAAACSGGGGDDDATPTTDPDEGVTTAGNDGPFAIRLSTGAPVSVTEDPIAVVGGDPLDQARIDEILQRLPALEEDPDDRQDFNRPPESLRPPIVGTTIDQPFGQAGEDPPPPVESGPLEVTRVQPEGDVDIAPFLSVTFDQPMVPLTTLDQLDDIEVPITISPELPGRWRWIGTKTARFEHDPEVFDRLPMATDYTVTIPAGTTSETGGVLASDETFTFSTPAVVVRSVTPMGDQLDVQPVFVASFDQLVDPEEALASVQLEADGREREVRLATDEEIEADEIARRFLDEAIPGRWVAFRPVGQMPTDAAVEIRFTEGFASLEGPKETTSDQEFTGRTYPPFEIRRSDCWSGDGCQPGGEFAIEMTTQIDLDRFDPDAVDIDPELPGAVVQAFGQTVVIRGASVARTDYDVTLPDDLTDIFGQRITGDRDVTFEVGDATPTISAGGPVLTTADPLADRPSIGVQSINHDELRIRTYAVTAGDWPAFQGFYEQWDRDTAPDLPFQELDDRTIDTEPDDGVFGETIIDLDDEIDGTGHVVVVIESTQQFSRDDDAYWQSRPIVRWVQATTIGLDAFSDGESLVVWATDLRNGDLLEGVAVGAGTATGTTDGDGLVTLAMPTGRVGQITGTVGGETALLGGEEGVQYWSRFERNDELRFFVFDDRGLYRPGETARVKGWARVLTLSDDAQITGLPAGTVIDYRAYDAFGNEFATGTVEPSSVGGFDLAVDIPAEANLGDGWIEFSTTAGPVGGGYTHRLAIAEFRRPEFEVTTRVESPGPHVVAEPTTVAATAEYFAGGALMDTPVVWRVTSADGTYRPPGWDDYTFGAWTPWWYIDDGFDACCFEGEETVETFEGRTDGTGTHYLRLDYEGQAPDLPIVVSANAAVTDVNRQQFAATEDVLVHAGRNYAGLRTERTFVDAGDDLVVDVIVADIDGEVVVGADVAVTMARLEWQFTDGSWQEVPADEQSCTVTSSQDVEQCTFPTEVGGTYRITAVVDDAQGGTNRTEFTRWVSGRSRGVPLRNVEQEELTLVPDARTYAPGDTVELLVQAPFADGNGLATVTRAGIESTVVFPVEDGSAVLRLPVEDRDIPGFDVFVEVVGSADRTDDDDSDLPPRPAFAVGALTVDVPPVSRTLDVAVVPADPVLQPGDDTSVTVTVVDAAGTPVEGAELTVVVVDEAVLSLTGYDVGDPLAAFYGPTYDRLLQAFARRSIVLARNDEFSEASPDNGATTTTIAASRDDSLEETDGDDAAADMAPGGAGGDQSGDGAPIQQRTDFDALAVFAPAVVTAADGTATVAVPLPDNLTRYRVMVLAADGAQDFGRGESNITARLPLQVRPSPPRFLNFGDEFELPIVVQNLSDSAVTADVVVDATNVVFTGARGVAVEVPANDRVEVRFPARADDAGTARIRAAVVGGTDSDAALLALPVYTPTTTEAFATYGVVDAGTIGQSVVTPEGVVPQFGALEVSTSSTALQALTDALIDLREYRFDHVDAYASRVLAVVALRDVLEAFDVADLPAPAEFDAVMADDLAAIARLQNFDGGFGTWRRGEPSSPYRSVQTAHALVAAKNAGYDPDESVVDAALFYLSDIENRFPADWSQAARDAVTAYALHVRDLSGDRDAGAARSLYQRDNLDLDGLAWIWPVIDDAGIRDEIARTFANRVTETPAAATFTTGYGEDAYLILASDRRTDGIILDAMIRMQPDSDLIPKIVTGLIGNQRQGSWNNVQENSFILQALKRYFDTFETETPDFVARVWLGDLYAAEHAYEGRSIDSNETLVPMAELLAQDDPSLVISKDGTGRLYYRLGLRYAPAELRLDPRDEGFVVDRIYEAVDDPSDVVRNDDGTWTIRAGASVRVTLTLVADSRRTNMALIDPLPAGLEIVNPELATAPDIPVEQPGVEDEFDDFEGGVVADYGFSSWWYGTWYDHQNQRDDRAEAFAGFLPAGTYTYRYIARATTPGRFVTPPAQGLELYAPEVFGRTSTDIVVVAE